MSKEAAPSPETPQAPRAWDETSIALLMEQFRIMVQREVRNMKLDVTENIAGMLARRSGLDKELHALTARVDLLAKSVEGLCAWRRAVEKGQPPARPRRGPIGAARDLERPAAPRRKKAGEVPPLVAPPRPKPPDEYPQRIVTREELQGRKTLRPREAAERVGLQEGSLYNMARKHKVPSYIADGKLVFAVDELDEWRKIPRLGSRLGTGFYSRKRLAMGKEGAL